MTKNMELPPNTLLHTFGVYNAVVRASDGTLIRWNNTLGFSACGVNDTTPFANIEGMTNIRAAVDAFVPAQST